MESNTTGSNNFSWYDVNWDALRRLRTRFLAFDQTGADHRDYWRSHSELASYDLTFGERIGWKWDALLAELAHRGWTAPAGSILDYGCGTGVAGRRVVKWARTAGAESDLQLLLWDRSHNAMRFAQQRAQEAFPSLPVQIGAPDRAASVLVVSHVINELAPEGVEQLLAAADRAQAVLWVEPGTAAAGKALIAARDRLLAGGFNPIAPCSHAGRCGMLAAGNERHWCHRFARPPAAAFRDAGWSRFAKLLEIDLGTVPFCCLVMDRRPAPESAAGASRIIGVPREYKGFAKILSCQSDGVRELILQKRDSPELFKEMKKNPGSLYRWERDGDKIRGGERLW